MKKVTVADIARKTNVSPGTVSNALNNRRGTISEKKRQEILQAAEELGYVRERKTNAIRLIFFQDAKDSVTDNTFFAALLGGIEKECTALGCQLLVNHLSYQDRIQGVRLMDDPYTCDGILILATYLREEQLHVFENMKLPHVFLDVAYNDQRNNYVAINNAGASYEMTRILIKAGFRKFGFITSSLYINNFRERKSGYLAALHDHEIPHEQLFDFRLDHVPDWSILFEKQLRKLQRSSKGLPEVFVCANDFLALITEDILDRLGIDAFVTGFDNVPEAESRALTTIQVNKQDFGRAGVRRLMDLIHEPHQTAQRIAVNTEIIVRGELLNI
ncbi:MAG: LacI family DNA-binding transcriptional regulator [Solobacterium sp.]|nr:LacI family DNA-binding transcriptional regulator [Solobacterium sp.]